MWRSPLAFVVLLVLSCSGLAESGSQKGNSPALAGAENLQKILAGTVWSWPDPKAKPANAWFRLNPDGTTTAGWHNKLRSWRVLSDDRAEVIAMFNSTKQILRFNADVTEATLEGQSNVIYRLIRKEGTGEGAVSRPGHSDANAATTGSLNDVTVKESAALVLSPSWNTPMQGGTNTQDDLGRLFSQVAKPSVNLAADPSIQVYEGVSYLTPFQQALKPLGITSKLPSKNPVICPGFPRDSLSYYAADGRFEGQYNRMYVVVDRAEQVVSVQLVDETPREQARFFQSKQDWATYNFVNARTKAMSKLRIDHQIYGKTKNGWSLGNPAPDTKMFRIDSVLLSPEDKFGNRWDLKEQVRWYVPKPIVELILTCVNAGGR